MNPLEFSNLGAHPSPPDYRDVKDYTLAGARPAVMKTEVRPPVDMFDQEKIGICTSSEITYIEWLYWKKTGVYTKLSRRFLYTVGKNLIDQDQIEGSSLRTMLKAAYHHGVCKESTFPSSVNGMSHQTYMDINAVPDAAWTEALDFKIGGYGSAPIDKEGFFSHLYKYGLLYTRMEIGKEWWTAPDGTVTWDKTKILPLLAPTQVISGHAVIHNGYEGGFADLINDWGLEWADQGSGFHVYDYYHPTEAWWITLDKIVNDLPAAHDYKHTFSKNLAYRQRDPEVVQLQIALMILGFLEYVPPADRGFYGLKTVEAVKQFLIARKISPNLLGMYFGPRGRAAMNAIFGG